MGRRCRPSGASSRRRPRSRRAPPGPRQSRLRAPTNHPPRVHPTLRSSYGGTLRNGVLSRRMEASSVSEEESHTFTRPVYLLDRPLPVRVLLVVVVPGALGLLGGFLLGQSKVLYLALQILVVIGGGITRPAHRGGRAGGGPGV